MRPTVVFGFLFLAVAGSVALACTLDVGSAFPLAMLPPEAGSSGEVDSANEDGSAPDAGVSRPEDAGGELPEAARPPPNCDAMTTDRALCAHCPGRTRFCMMNALGEGKCVASCGDECDGPYACARCVSTADGSLPFAFCKSQAANCEDSLPNEERCECASAADCPTATSVCVGQVCRTCGEPGTRFYVCKDRAWCTAGTCLY